MSVILVSCSANHPGARPFYNGSSFGGWYVEVRGAGLPEDDVEAINAAAARGAHGGACAAIRLEDGRVLVGRAHWQRPGASYDVTALAALLRCR